MKAIYLILLLIPLNISAQQVKLDKYMIEYNVGVSTKKVYAIKKIDTDYFEE